MLYMSGETQAAIRERCNIGSPSTLIKWINEGDWKAKRAASTITRTELVNKILGKISEILEQDTKDFNPDQLVKLAASIERLDKKGNVITIMDVFVDFSHWLTQKATLDRNLSIETIKLFNTYQDAYISSKLAGSE